MNYLSYSLFGQDERYFIGLCDRIREAEIYYPSWKVVVYVCEKVPKEWLAYLESVDINLTLKEQNCPWDGLYWRFLALSINDCDCAIIRDSDSKITKREVRLVKEWLSSRYTVHTIRDHIGHAWPMNAGMWGFKGRLDLSKEIDKWSYKHIKSGDQHFLRRKIYKKYKGDIFAHTTGNYFKGEDVKFIDSVKDFIGRPYWVPLEEEESHFRTLLKNKSYLRELMLDLDVYRRKLKRILYEN